MINPDIPIANTQEDRLNRFPLAKEVAKLVSDYKNTESLVIGIEGKWGSGKTSFVNLIINELSENEKFMFVKFNPWNFHGQNELISDFFTSISDVIETNGGKNLSKKIKSISLKLSRKTELVVSPEFTALWGLVQIKSNDLFKIGVKEKSLETERSEIDEIFIALDSKVVIVIDDIDRLDNEETKLVMKMVKMTANFPNSIFILCYDHEKVARMLDNQFGEEYLKKIVQLTFSLPALDNTDIQPILITEIEKLLINIYGDTMITENDERRWSELMYSGFLKPFNTIRDVNRYINSLRLSWSILIKEEINIIDFLTLELIRIFAPDLYIGIYYNSELFVENRLNFHYWGVNEDINDTSVEKLVELAPRNIRSSMMRILRIVFPRLDANENYLTNDLMARMRTEKRVCDPQRFRIYFKLEIHKDIIQESEVNYFLSTINNETILETTLRSLSFNNRLRGMLLRLLDNLSVIKSEEIKNLVLVIWRLEKDVYDERNTMFDFFNVENITQRIALEGLKNNPLEKRYLFVESLIQNCNSLYSLTCFVLRISEIIEKKNYSLKLTYKEFELIRDALVKKIMEFVHKGNLNSQIRHAFIMFRLIEWGVDEVQKQYLDKLLELKFGAIYFVKSCVSKVITTSTIFYRLERETIEKLCQISRIKKIVSELTAEDIETLDSKSKTAIYLFNDLIENNDKNVSESV